MMEGGSINTLVYLGFTLPFAVMGGTLFLSSVFIFFVLPETPPLQEDPR